MPVLKTTRELKDVALQTVEGGVAKVITAVLGEDIEKILKLRDGEAGPLAPLTIIVREWNLTGEDGAALPVTVDNLRLLKLADVTAIFAAVDGLNDFFGQAQSAPTTK